MEDHAIFLDLLLILVSARLLGELAAHLEIPPVMGEMAAGILLGPSLLGWVAPSDLLEVLAEFGLILLLFEVGLDTDVSRVLHTGRKAFVVAIGGFVLPFLGGFAAAHWLFSMSTLVSLLIGGTLTATSIGVTTRVLRDLNQHNSHEAQVVLGAAVFDDILGVVLLSLLFEFAVSGGINLLNASKVFVFIAIFMMLAPVIAKFMADTVGRYYRLSVIPGLVATSIASIVLFFAWLAHQVGAPELLGGFAAGLALSRRFFLPFGWSLSAQNIDFAELVETKMKPIIHLFTPIFFVMVGLSIDLQTVDWTAAATWSLTLAFTVVAILGKLGGAMFIDEPWHRRLAIGTAMIPRAEVGLIFAELGRSSGLFDEKIHAIMILTIAITTVLPPFAMKGYYRRYGGQTP